MFCIDAVADPEVGTLGVLDIMKKNHKLFTRSLMLVFFAFPHNNMYVCTSAFVSLRFICSPRETNVVIMDVAND